MLPTGSIRFPFRFIAAYKLKLLDTQQALVMKGMFLYLLSNEKFEAASGFYALQDACVSPSEEDYYIGFCWNTPYDGAAGVR